MSVLCLPLPNGRGVRRREPVTILYRPLGLLCYALKPFSNWRSSLKVGLVLNIVIVVINIVLLMVAAARQEFPRTSIFSGDCSVMNSRSIGLALFVNIASPFCLGSANAAAQCLMAPTKHDVVEAHQSGKALEIGVISLHNLKFIPTTRRVLCVLLLPGSLPLHLL